MADVVGIAIGGVPGFRGLGDKKYNLTYLVKMTHRNSVHLV